MTKDVASDEISPALGSASGAPDPARAIQNSDSWETVRSGTSSLVRLFDDVDERKDEHRA